MKGKDLKYVIESILFATGEAVKKEKLAEVLSVGVNTVCEKVEVLRREYDDENRGFMIIDVDGGYQMCTRPTYFMYIQEMFGERRKQALSNAAMESLAIIAYKQPVTRTIIENIRGVNSDGAVNRLLERGLFDEAGRLDAPGRPILYGTTQVFLRSFGLQTLNDLPPLDTKLKKEYDEFEQITIDDIIDEDGNKIAVSDTADTSSEDEKTIADVIEK